MKRIIFVVFFLLAAMVCNAQYSDTTAQKTSQNVAGNEYEVHWQAAPKSYKTGRTLVFTGAGIAFGGIVWMSFSELSHRKNYNPDCPTMSLAPYVAIATTALGAIVAAIGTPFFFVGKASAKKNGLSLDEGCYGEYKGFGLILEGSFGYDPTAGMRATAGYHFNNHLFVGGGAAFGVTIQKYITESTRFSIPVFASARYTFGSQKVNPYVGIDFGGYGDCNSEHFWPGLYGAFNFGINIRTSNKNSVWIASTNEIYSNARTFGLRAGYSF